MTCSYDVYESPPTPWKKSVHKEEQK